MAILAQGGLHGGVVGTNAAGTLCGARRGFYQHPYTNLYVWLLGGRSKNAHPRALSLFGLGPWGSNATLSGQPTRLASPAALKRLRLWRSGTSNTTYPG